MHQPVRFAVGAFASHCLGAELQLQNKSRLSGFRTCFETTRLRDFQKCVAVHQERRERERERGGVGWEYRLYRHHFVFEFRDCSRSIEMSIGHVLLRVVESLRTVRACWLLHPQEIWCQTHIFVCYSKVRKLQYSYSTALRLLYLLKPLERNFTWRHHFDFNCLNALLAKDKVKAFGARRNCQLCRWFGLWRHSWQSYWHTNIAVTRTRLFLSFGRECAWSCNRRQQSTMWGLKEVFSSVYHVTVTL